MSEWRYGDSWEKYPIQTGETWVESGGSKIAVWDLFNGLPDFMLEADLIYCDPPWNTGNIRTFYTKAGLKTSKTHREFTEVLFQHIARIDAPTCYLEIGKQNLRVFRTCMATIYPSVQGWPVTYYRHNPSFLVRGGQMPTTFDFTGMDDMDTPLAAMEAERFSVVADLCMGRGLTATVAFGLDKQFVGTELNRRRLACTIEKIAEMEGSWSIIRP